MRKISFIICLIFIVALSTSSCNQYKSISSATKISQLSGNPFYFNLSKSLLKNIGLFLMEKGTKKSIGKINLMTPLSSILTSNDQIQDFKAMLTKNYQVYPKKLDAQFGKLGNLKDLISFVAYNGRNFNFHN